ncbi:MAG TPA: hypothetical protein VN033_08440 [Vulgatibacter sp.]|nr:hypothetical protein [Vulgatibacter sp.]
MTRSGAALFGPGVDEYPAPSWFADLSTLEGVAASVGEIVARVSGGPYEGQYAGRCTGVLVARDKLLTTAACMIDLEGEYGTFLEPPDLYVRFPQVLDLLTNEPAWIPVVGVWRTEGTWDEVALSSSSFAVLTLLFELVHAEVAQIAPVFFSDVERAIQDGILLADDAVVAGFGPSCDWCMDDGRRLGKLGTPVQTFASGVGGHPFLISNVRLGDDDPGAEFGINRLDRGGPLFLREAQSNRYVVVGSYLATLLESVDGDVVRTKRFTYLGRMGDTNPDYDHAEIIRPHLGEFIDGEPCAPKEVLAGPNSNFEAEMDLDRRIGGMEYLADRCDSVPLMLHETPLSKTSKASKIFFSVRPWLGNGAVTPEFYEWPVSRFCDCFDESMDPLDEAACLEIRCFAGEVNKGRGGWKGIDLYQTNEDGGVMFIPAGTGGPYVRVREGRLGEGETFEWDWTADVPGHIRGHRRAGSKVSTRGYLGVSLESLGRTRSERDDLWEHDLRGTVSFREFDHSPNGGPPIPPPPPPIRPCPVSKCVMWGTRPSDFDVDGLRGDPVWKPGPPPHAIAKNEEERLVLMGAREDSVDITNALGPLLREIAKMKEGGEAVRWLSAEEGPQALASLGIPERAAVVTSAGAVFSVVSGGGMMEAVEAGSSGLLGFAAPMTAQAAATTLASMISTASVTIDLPSNGRALYSATEGAIFVVKGPDVTSGGMIRRTDLASGLTTTLSFAGAAPSGTILGATFDSDAGKFFVLDAVEGQARLASYDIAQKQGRILWTVPFSGAFDFVALSRAATGELVLIAGSQGDYTAWLVREKSNGVVAFLGRLERSGVPLDEPVMGAYAPVLAVEAPEGELRYDHLDPREFVNGAPCESL